MQFPCLNIFSQHSRARHSVWSANGWRKIEDMLEPYMRPFSHTVSRGDLLSEEINHLCDIVN